MRLTSEELKQLKASRAKARLNAIQISKRFKLLKKVFHVIEAKYDTAIREYNKLDRDYAFALHEQKKIQSKPKPAKAYDANKRTAAKALKALENLPKEMRDKIIKNAQDGLF